MSDHHENPLSLELKSLRQTVARFQEEAHASAVKLQRNSLDAVRVHERAGQLERENDLLKAEIAILRANPAHSESAASSKHIQDQLTLSLRRQTQKTALAEEAIAAKTAEVVQLKTEAYRAQVSAENAYELGARVRGREEELRGQQREMEGRIVLLEEDLRMADKVIKEYAALVRGMEKSTSTPEASLSSVYEEAQRAQGALISKHRVDTEYMEKELQEMLSRLEVTISQLEAERKAKEALEQELSRTQAELENHRLDDATSAKMVARYMQFSQTSTNDLLNTLSALKSRHEGTLSTLSAQNHQLTLSLASLKAQNDRLRGALDESGGELAKESYGRRREVALRIRMGRREARLVEALRRWVRAAEERLAKLTHAREYEVLAGVVQEARIVLEQLDEGVADAESAIVVSGEGARQFLVNDGVEGLLEELRLEMDRRVRLEKALAQTYGQSNGNGVEHGAGQQDAERSPLDTVASSGDSTPPEVPAKSPMAPSHPYVPATPAALNGQLPPDEPEPQQISPVGDTTTGVSENLPPSEGGPSEQVEETPGISDPVASLLNENEKIPVGSAGDPSHSEVHPVVPVEQDPTIHPEATTPKELTSPAMSSQSIEEDSSKSDVEQPDPLAGPVPPSSSLTDNSLESALAPSLDLSPSQSDNTLADTSSSSSVPSITTAPTLSPPSPLTPIHLADELPVEVNTKIPETKYPLEEPHPPSDDTTPATPISHLEETSRAQIQTPSTDIMQSPAPVSVGLSPSDAPIARVPTTAALPAPHPLLADLARVGKRYDALQRAFRDCHLALEGLQASLKETSLGNPPSSLPIPPHILTAALGRLDDYIEDAQVELEIRISDEVILAKGYEALLSVPGAMSTRPTNTSGAGDDDEPVQSEVENQITEFVAGTDSAVKRARHGLTRKLEDVQHDIAALKRAIFDPDAFVPPSTPAPQPSSASHSPSSSISGLALPSSPSAQPAGWSSWIRTPTLSRPASPAPPSHGPAPTFGNIMTAPRLRSSPSSTSLRQPQQQTQDASRSRRPSFFGLASASPPEKEKDPLAVLGLKVPMPSFAFGFGATSPPPTSGSPFGGAGGFPGVLSPTSPMTPMIHAAPGGPRPRTVSSTMYMLGLGASSTALPRMPRSVSSAAPVTSPLASGAHPYSKSSQTMDIQPPRHDKLDSSGQDSDSDVE